MAKYYWRGGATGTWNGKPRPWPPHKIFNCEEYEQSGATYSEFYGLDVNNKDNWTLVPPGQGSGGGNTYSGYPAAPSTPKAGDEVYFQVLFFGSPNNPLHVFPSGDSIPVGTILTPNGTTAARLKSVHFDHNRSCHDFGVWRQGLSYYAQIPGQWCSGIDSDQTELWGPGQWASGAGCCAFSFYANDVYLTSTGGRRASINVIPYNAVPGATQHCTINITNNSNGILQGYGTANLKINGHVKKITSGTFLQPNAVIYLMGPDMEYGLTRAHVHDQFAVDTRYSGAGGVSIVVLPGATFTHSKPRFRMSGRNDGVSCITGCDISNVKIQLHTNPPGGYLVANGIGARGGPYLLEKYNETTTAFFREHPDYGIGGWVWGCMGQLGECPGVTFGEIEFADNSYSPSTYGYISPALGVDRVSCSVNKFKVEKGSLNITGNQNVETVTINGGYLNPANAEIKADSPCLYINDDPTVNDGFVIRTSGLETNTYQLPIYVKGNENLRINRTDSGYTFGVLSEMY
jgi:hypothetical protein